MQIGDRVTFCPSELSGNPGKQGGDEFRKKRMVTGVVDYINVKHRWCDVVYWVNGHQLHEGFKIVPKRKTPNKK